MKNIILDSETKSLEAVMSAAVATTAPNFVTSYTVFDPDDESDKLVETSSDGVLNGTTAVTLVSAPAIGERVVIGEVAIYNADSVSIAVTLQYKNNVTVRKIATFNLSSGESWFLSSGGNFTSISTETDPVVGAIDGIVKSDGTGNISAAHVGVDYQSVLAEGGFVDGDKTKLNGISEEAETNPILMTEQEAILASETAKRTINAVVLKAAIDAHGGTSSSANIDGGSAGSVYLPAQLVDGGNA